jgi:hypothetical protein
MRLSRFSVLLAAALGGLVLTASTPAAAEEDGPRVPRRWPSAAFALLGDTPYGEGQSRQLPALVDHIKCRDAAPFRHRLRPRAVPGASSPGGFRELP